MISPKLFSRFMNLTARLWDDRSAKAIAEFEAYGDEIGWPSRASGRQLADFRILTRQRKQA
jgi:hypothetical protein